MEKLDNEVISFFRKALSNSKLSKSSYLNDFCKNEDNAYYLFLEFFESFNIEKGHLDLDKYFYSKSVFFDIFKLAKPSQSTKPKISIAHLIKVAEKKEWFDPDCADS